MKSIKLFKGREHMGNKKMRKIVVYLMLISMILTTLLSGIAFLL
ncbi:stressosome-associated protein Prli42 [Peribacillus muralis]